MKRNKPSCVWPLLTSTSSNRPGARLRQSAFRATPSIRCCGCCGSRPSKSEARVWLVGSSQAESNVKDQHVQWLFGSTNQSSWFGMKHWSDHFSAKVCEHTSSEIWMWSSSSSSYQQSLKPFQKWWRGVALCSLGLKLVTVLPGFCLTVWLCEPGTDWLTVCVNQTHWLTVWRTGCWCNCSSLLARTRLTCCNY